MFHIKMQYLNNQNFSQPEKTTEPPLSSMSHYKLFFVSHQ